MAVTVAILGLNEAGVSTALALQAKGADIRCRGWDADPERRAAADASGAFHPVSKKVKDVLAPAVLVILNLPPDDLKKVLGEFKENFRPGAVLVNISRLHALPAKLVKESLGSNTNFVSLLPVLNPAFLQESLDGTQNGRADIFMDSLAYITAPPAADAKVLDTAVDLAVLLGSLPVFADADEVDGLMAANLLLPELAASALMNAISTQPSWRDGKTIAGSALAHTTAPLAEIRLSDTAQNAHANRDNTVRLLDELVSSLQRTKQALQAADSADLEALLARAVEARREWLKSRQRAGGNKAATSSIPTEAYALKRFLKLGG